MIAPMPGDQTFSLDTRILDLASRSIPRFGAQSARKLALALTEISPGKDINSVNVEDLLGYLPARYEDRSSMVEIRHLYHGVEASLDLTVRVSGPVQLRNRRNFRKSLYKFEISAVDQKRSGKQVVV